MGTHTRINYGHTHEQVFLTNISFTPSPQPPVYCYHSHSRSPSIAKPTHIIKGSTVRCSVVVESGYLETILGVSGLLKRCRLASIESCVPHHHINTRFSSWGRIMDLHTFLSSFVQFLALTMISPPHRRTQSEAQQVRILLQRQRFLSLQ